MGRSLALSYIVIGIIRPYCRRLDALTGVGSQTSCSNMTDLSNASPRRYFVDNHGQRVLVGLTIEETSEFEELDNLAASNTRAGHVLWEKGFPATKQEERWLELYTKHDKAWTKWMADTRANRTGNSPFLN
jgi:hypothetical protein